MAAMTARMRRLVSDWEQIQKDFGTHKYITITPLGTEPYERYHVTYFVKGIYLNNGNVVTIDRHEVEITLHADYPRYKPKCEILTPIYHPNFRDGQICIGDIWGAGESLSDIIINIGDMIQYKSWNSYSPLSAEAAQWALENRHLFPVGNISLHVVEEDSKPETVEIDLFEDFNGAMPDPTEMEVPVQHNNETALNDSISEIKKQSIDQVGITVAKKSDENDFEITAEELVGISYVPAAERMQSAPRAELVKKKKINFKTVLSKGLLWALIGAILGFTVTELIGGGGIGSAAIARLMGQENLAKYYEYTDISNDASAEVDAFYKKYCKYKGYSADYGASFDKWYDAASSSELAVFNRFSDAYNKADSYLSKAEKNYSGDDFYGFVNNITAVSTGLWTALFALFVGMMMGIGEGVYYGSKNNAIKYALMGAGISLAVGFVAGYIAQELYAVISSDASTFFGQAFTRAIGWSILGLGIAAGTGLIKPEKRRMKFCLIGGAIGGFLGGFLFDVIGLAVSNDAVSRGVGLIITGALVGIGIGLLEQFAKQAWLKVVRGEFEGKEYLVFAGTTSIGNNGQNIIVLFKDKLVAPHHCDIVQQGGQYVLIDAGSPLGTVVNGMKVTKQTLKHGDSISVGNSVLVFNTK